MIIIKEQGTFTVKNFSKLYDNEGTEVTDITTVPPASVLATVDTKLTVTGVSALDLKAGDTVEVQYSNGLKEYRAVVQAGTNIIKFKEILDANAGDSVNIGTLNTKVTLGSTVEEGQYYTDANEVVIVANTFSNLYINKSTIQMRYSNLADNISIDLLNKDAKEALVSDFSLFPLFYKTLDLGQLTELLKRKILSILELSEGQRDINNLTFTQEYKNFKGSIVNILNTAVDNAPNGDITNGDVTGGSASISWQPKTRA